MIDFYKKLGLDNYDQSEDEFNNKLHSLPRDIQEAIIYILLTNERKWVYDKVHKTLKQVGILRNFFGDAVDSEFWGIKYSDFNIPAKDYVTKEYKKTIRRYIKTLLGFSPLIIIGITSVPS